MRLFSFFFRLSRPPPRPTLFPYTTLFRSLPAHLHDPDRRNQAHQEPKPSGGEKSLPASSPKRGSGNAGQQQRCRRDLPDRKSTRLNSSHSSISYAVFCLKKKTSTDHADTS